MTNYELYIEDTNGIFQVADFIDEVPAMNYQANNIAELIDRQANYSQNVKLAMTERNIKIFDYIHIVDVKSDFAYRKHACHLLADGFDISGSNAFIVVDQVTDCFECQILSGNADFFELLKNREMNTLDLGSIVLGPSGRNKDNFNFIYRYVVAGFTYGVSNVKSLYPVVEVGGIIRTIMQQLGYSLDSTIPIDIYSNLTMLSLVSMKPSEDSLDAFKAKASGNYSESQSTVGVIAYWCDFTIESNGNNWLKKFGYGTGTSERGLEYTVTEDCDVTLVFNIQGTVTNAKLTYLVSVLDEESASTISERTGSGYVDTVTVQAKKGNKIRITLMRGDTRMQSDPSFSVNVTYTLDFSIAGNVIPEGGKLYFSNNLGYDTWFDLFKAIVQLFGMFVIVDGENKIVKFRNVSDLYQAIDNGDFVDWSEKLRMDNDNTIIFHDDGYGQNNIFRLEKNSKSEFEDTGNFVIDDETLAKWKEMGTISFEGGKNITVYGDGNTYECALVELEEQDGTFKEIKKPHVLTLTDVVHSDSVGEVSGVNGYYLAVHKPLQFYIDFFYGDLARMLDDHKIIECEFYLTPKDIQNFDPMVPVWIEKFGGYFYVNKISNFISGRLTKCELIRL